MEPCDHIEGRCTSTDTKIVESYGVRHNICASCIAKAEAEDVEMTDVTAEDVEMTDATDEDDEEEIDDYTDRLDQQVADIND